MTTRQDVRAFIAQQRDCIVLLCFYLQVVVAYTCARSRATCWSIFAASSHRLDPPCKCQPATRCLYTPSSRHCNERNIAGTLLAGQLYTATESSKLEIPHTAGQLDHPWPYGQSLERALACLRIKESTLTKVSLQWESSF